jgi:hypothetical protein
MAPKKEVPTKGVVPTSYKQKHQNHRGKTPKPKKKELSEVAPKFKETD